MPNMPTAGLEIWAVEWEDAHFSSLEYEREEINHKPTIYITTGILVKQDDTGITLANDISQTGSFRGTNFIPRKMVVGNPWKIGPLTRRRTKTTPPIKPPSSPPT